MTDDKHPDLGSMDPGIAHHMMTQPDHEARMRRLSREKEERDARDQAKAHDIAMNAFASRAVTADRLAVATYLRRCTVSVGSGMSMLIGGIVAVALKKPDAPMVFGLEEIAAAIERGEHVKTDERKPYEPPTLTELGTLEEASVRSPELAHALADLVHACSVALPCCSRVNEYNGYGSDSPHRFTCAKKCPCHD